MFKKLILKLINSVFGLTLTEADLDSFIAFIKMIFELFGKADGVAYINRTTRKAKMAVSKEKAKLAFEGMEKTLGEA